MVFMLGLSLSLLAEAREGGGQDKTAFSTHRQQFQWRVMLFDLTNGPASFT